MKALRFPIAALGVIGTLVAVGAMRVSAQLQAQAAATRTTSDDARSVDDLLRQAHSHDVFERAGAFEDLAQRGAAGAKGLATLLGDQDQQTRYKAAVRLGGMGADAQTAIPSLVQLARTPAGSDREAAATALYRIDPMAAKDAGVAKPPMVYRFWLNQNRSEFQRETLGVSSGPPDGPIVVWINGDPIGVYNGGGMALAMNEWLHPGANELTLSLARERPVYVKISEQTGLVGPDVRAFASQTFAPEGAAEPARPLVFRAGQTPPLPNRDSLESISRPRLESEVNAFLKNLADQISHHQGKQAAELLYGGQRLWDKAAYGSTDPEIQETFDKGAASFSDPQAAVTLSNQPLQLLVGRRAFLVFIELSRAGQPPRGLLTITSGKTSRSIPLLVLARVEGKLVTWGSSRVMSLRISAK